MKLLTKAMKVSSILMIFASIIRFFFGITFMNFFATAVNMRQVGKEQMPFLLTAFVVTVLSAPGELVAGIIGAATCEEPSFVHRGFIAGIAALVVSVAGMIMQVIIGYGASEVTVICGIVCPAVFVVFSLLGTIAAAKKRKKKAAK